MNTTNKYDLIENTLLTEVSGRLKEFDLLRKKLLVATSGGNDSTALLLIINSISKTYNIELEAIHINHQLRGQESENDQNFISELCKDIGVNLIVKNGNPNDTKNTTKNLENHLRNIRYDIFANTVKKKGFEGVIIAHHLNDHVETFLMKISRGAGLDGMEGIKSFIKYKAVDNLKVYSPLLQIPKKILTQYCYSQGISPRQDSSNLINSFSRNRVRNKIMPEFEKLNNNFLDSINRLTKIISSMNSQEKERIKLESSSLEIDEMSKDISFSRQKFNELSLFDKKLFLKIKFTELSNNSFIENKHLDYIVEKSKSNTSNFSLDLPNSLKLIAKKTRLSLVDTI